MPSENLTPEQRKAIKVVQESLPFWNQFLCSDPGAPDIITTDTKTFILQKITYSNLHHGQDWIWNQSNAKKTVAFENDISVVVQKFNTRKKNKTSTTDGMIFKLWMFYVYKQSENTFLGVFIWCEKGYPPFVPQKTNFPMRRDNTCDYCIDANTHPIIPIHDISGSISENEVPVHLTLDDLDFLKPFVDEQTAFSFGW